MKYYTYEDVIRELKEDAKTMSRKEINAKYKDALHPSVIEEEISGD